jgi:hypothetical protein
MTHFEGLLGGVKANEFSRDALVKSGTAIHAFPFKRLHKPRPLRSRIGTQLLPLTYEYHHDLQTIRRFHLRIYTQVHNKRTIFAYVNLRRLLLTVPSCPSHRQEPPLAS